jgi:ATP phosphoribosyltransferase
MLPKLKELELEMMRTVLMMTARELGTTREDKVVMVKVVMMTAMMEMVVLPAMGDLVMGVLSTGASLEAMIFPDMQCFNIA